MTSLAAADLRCFHCGLPADHSIHSQLRDNKQYFCCYGCQAVAHTIVEGGLVAFYDYRDAQNRPVDDPEYNFEAYDLEPVQEDFVIHLNDDAKLARLIIEGISCAACVWLIEQRLAQLPGVCAVNVNSVSHQAAVTWRHTEVKLSQIMSVLRGIGYSPKPNTKANIQGHDLAQHKRAIVRLGVAGFGMMQAGMFAVALHAGDIQGIDPHWRGVLRWVSLLLTTPVMLLSASVFFTNAYRALSNQSLNMDVPVSLALLLAFGASVYATVTQSGEVYFDSICMFTFFLLVGRFLEERLRYNNAQAFHCLGDLLPLTVMAKQQQQDSFQEIALKQLHVDDEIIVHAGALFPADGVVLEGKSTANEAVLTGESRLIEKSKGQSVVAGSMNGETQLTIKVTACGEHTQLSAIEQWSIVASDKKPQQVSLADQLSRYFVAFVLLVALGVYGVWMWLEPTRALWVTLSVLVVTCPCALSLATPAVFTAALHWARRVGVIMTSAQHWESMASIDDIIFDKTGTLTRGELRVERVERQNNVSEYEVLQVCAALEKHSKHPIAKAFVPYDSSSISVFDVQCVPGLGLNARIDADHYTLGSPDLVTASHNVSSVIPLTYPDEGVWILLSKNQAPLAWIKLSDSLRDDARQTITSLKKMGKNIHILSGDRADNVAPLASELSIEHWLASQRPEAKLAYVKTLQQAGRKVLMVGDGINDAPVLGGADLSLAMADATQLAHTQADGVLLNNQLDRLPLLLTKALQVQTKVKQNLAWALFYNITALPVAAMGFVPPWLAAIGMSLSSLMVVLNALLVNR